MRAHGWRVVVFLEPIARYMTKDQDWLVPYQSQHDSITEGTHSVSGDGEVAIVTFANGRYLAGSAAKILRDEHEIKVKIIDLH